VAVKSVLVSFDFRRKDCDTVGRFARIVADNVAWLGRNGHPKWRTVDLEYPLRGWEQHDCVRKQLGKPGASQAVARPAGVNPVMDAIKNILGD